MEPAFSLKESKSTRKSGHYWVQWAGHYSAIDIWKKDIWRIAAYHDRSGTWRLIDDSRIYYDADFIKINENRIPFTKGRLHIGGWVYWSTVIAYLIAALIFIHYLLIHR